VVKQMVMQYVEFRMMLTRRARGLLDRLVPEGHRDGTASSAIMNFNWSVNREYGIDWAIVNLYLSHDRDYNYAALFINANINENAVFEPLYDAVREPIVRKEYTGIRKDVYDYCIFAGISNQPENLDVVNKFIEAL